MTLQRIRTGILLNKSIHLGLAFLVLVIIVLIPVSVSKGGSDAVLSSAGRNSLAVLAFALVLWITEAVPFHITGLISMALLTVLRVDSFKNIVSVGFGNDVVVFMIGVLTLSAVVNQSGLGRRATLFLLSRIGNRTNVMILGFLCIGSVFSMWLSNMAMAAILMPLARGILKDEGMAPQKSNFGRALLIACAWGPSIGGIGTPAGAGPNPIAIGFLADIAGVQLSFLRWTLYGFPLSIVLILPAWLILIKIFPSERTQLNRSRDDFQREYKKLPPLGRAEKATIAIFLATIALWLSAAPLGRLLGIHIPISLSVIVTSSVFFFPSVTGIRWKDIEKEISWGSVVLVLAGVSIGSTLHSSGAAAWLSLKLLGGLGNLHPLVMIFVTIAMVSLLKIVLSSNSVSATITVPIMISFALNSGLPVVQTVLPAAITSSLSFILVTSAPTNVITYTAGYYSIWDMAKAGLLYTLAVAVLGALVIFGISSVAK